MKSLNSYIIEKLKINKEVKSNEYISGKEMFSFLKHYIFDQIHKVNTVNLSTFESFITSFKNDKFNIYCLPEHKQIWGATTNFDFINYENYENYKDPEFTNNLYLGGGIYIWFNDKKDNIAINISESQFNDFDHGYKSIIINRK